MTDMGPGNVTVYLEDCSSQDWLLPPPAFLRPVSPFLSRAWMHTSGCPKLLKCHPCERVLDSFLCEDKTVCAKAPLDNTYLLGLGLPNPALQALCKLITASETGEQLISRVSWARTAEPRPEGSAKVERE